MPTVEARVRRGPLHQRRVCHAEDVKYTAYVMWLVGYSEKSIAVVLGLRRKQAAGIIAASEYANRSAMSVAARQAKLRELEEIRCEDGHPLDGGRLDRCTFRAMPLTEQQVPARNFEASTRA